MRKRRVLNDDNLSYRLRKVIHHDGICSHSGRPCFFANRCTLEKIDCCRRILTNNLDMKDVYKFCGVCRKLHRGKCLFECFREEKGSSALKPVRTSSRGKAAVK